MIHKFKIKDKLLVLDVYSGSVHQIDELIWDLLDSYPALSKEECLKKYQNTYSLSEIEEAIDELEELRQEGSLFATDPLDGCYEPKQEKIIKALCLHLAHDCNLACRYCFAGQGKFGGEAGMMSEDVGRKAIDLLLEKSANRTHVEVDFFGGEPLLNKKVMYSLIDYGKKQAKIYNKEIQFTVTTNTLLLDEEVTKFLNEQDMHVVLSLDGRQKVHDTMRPLAGGGSSYGIILDRINRFIASRGHHKYYVRGTYTRNNLDFSNDVIHMVENGFKEVSIEPVIASPEEDYALKEDDLPIILEEYVRLADFMLSKINTPEEFSFFHFNIDGGTCLPKRLTGCSAGVEYFAVDPKGFLYPCHQFVGQDEFKIGDVFQGILREDLRAKFSKAHVYSKDECKKCWAKYYCSGGCHAAAFAKNNDLLKPDSFACTMMKKRIECALYVKAVLAERNNFN